MPVPENGTAVERERSNNLRTDRINFQMGVYVNKFSPLRERQRVGQKQDKSSPQAERYPTTSCYYLLSSQAPVKSSTRTS